MNPGEYEVMARSEANHWWYRGLRDVVVRSLANPRFEVPPHPRILDAGCGTGQNLAALRDAFAPSLLAGFDASPEALLFAEKKVPEAQLFVSDICQPELSEADLDVVISLDVVYIPGAERAHSGLQRMVEQLRPGGLFLMNLPAYDWLYSQHDVAVHTAERYTARRVADLMESIGLRVELLTYRLCLLFPLVAASRLPSLWSARPGDRAAQSDLHRSPGRLSNDALYAVVRGENTLIERGLRMPFGSSVFAIGQKR